jgi:hypothetical protein
MMYAEQYKEPTSSASCRKPANLNVNIGEEKAMESGFEVCPKCNGKGIMRYKVWESRLVLLGFPLSKTDKERATAHMWIIRIKCPGCDGSGKIDWVKTATRGSTLDRPFAALEGNMDIYFSRAVESWPSNCPTHVFKMAKVGYLPEHAGKIIELSQVRYTGIKLNPVVLTLSADGLNDLYNLVVEYQGYLMSLPGEEVTEQRIRDELTSRGLGDFMPDKFAYPGPDDVPNSKI